MSLNVGDQRDLEAKSKITRTIVTRVNGVDVKKTETVVEREGVKTYVDTNGSEAGGRQWRESATKTSTETDL